MLPMLVIEALTWHSSPQILPIGEFGLNLLVTDKPIGLRYTAASGAKVFSTGSIQWVWGLDSDNVINPRVDIRAQQITINVLKDMGAKPQTPSSGIVV